MSEHERQGARRGRRLATRAAGAVVALAAAMVLAVAPAGAHGGAGIIEVGDPEPSGDLTYTVPVRITYEADGHAVEPADLGELSVTGSSPSGLDWAAEASSTPGDAPGVYDLRVTFPEPGTWDLTVRSTEPPAEAPLTVEVAATDTTAAPTTDPPTTEGSEATEDPDLAEDPAVTTGAGEIVERSDDDAPTGLIVALVVCAVLAVAAGLLIRRARASERVSR